MLSSVLKLSTDASDLGMGAVFDKCWWASPFDDSHLSFPIAWRELYAVVVACRVWGHSLVSKRVLIVCDNEAIVFCVSNGTLKNVAIMDLIRSLFFVCAYYSFDVRCKHVPGVLNVGPDLLSTLTS